MDVDFSVFSYQTHPVDYTRNDDINILLPMQWLGHNGRIPVKGVICAGWRTGSASLPLPSNDLSPVGIN